MKQTIRKQTLMSTIVPLFLMAIVICMTAITTTYKSVTDQIQQEMKRTADYVLDRYNKLYPGDFDVEMDSVSGKYKVFKGTYEITNDYDLIDSVALANGVGITIFCKNIRVLTNMLDENNVRYIDSKCATQVENDVINGKTDHFYTDVKLNGEAYYAYYMPILQSDGTLFGMIGVVRSAAAAQKLSAGSVVPVVIACLLSVLLVSMFIVAFAKKLSSRIDSVEHFMKKVSEGNFNNDMTKNVFEKDDEIKSLGNSGKTMQKSLEQLVEYDALTKLHNRRFGDKKLKEIMKTADSTGINYCVAIGDIDFFKKVNDTYGHDAGDAVLVAVAEQLAKGVAGKGFVARWGGEEFLMVLRMCDLTEGTKILEDILVAVRAIEVHFEDQVIKVTMSMGITTGDYKQTADEQIKRADDNLYYAKEHGRNQIISK